MYCSNCGIAVSQALTYCNHCGAKLIGDKRESLVKTTELRAESLIISAMVGLFILGLTAVGFLLGVMRAVLEFNQPQLLGFAAISFLMLIGLEGILISRLFRRKHAAAGETEDRAVIKNQASTKELESQSRVVVEPVASVTDHTTRTLDPIYNEQK